ncbi:MAG: TIGR00282 family metallophosphoesterase [Planctomycetaceae bacterium]|nr:TIGR00282 family metallophosphoesterase [Planctomycetaceae bacterium]
MKVKVFCIGDIVGRPGRRILAEQLHAFIREQTIDCVIANAENSAGGSGMTQQIYEKLCRYGVNLVTLGDHCFRKKEIIPVLENQSNIVRPANLSPYAAGKDYAIFTTSKGVTVAVVTLIGRIFMKPADCPYARIDSLLSKLRSEADLVFVEVHAEATSEKMALGRYLDGRVSCVFGSHTHVMTADEQIFAGGTAYITDIGMTGPMDSVLGRSSESVIRAFRTQMPYPFEIASGDVKIHGILVTVDSHTKKAEFIERIVLSETTPPDALTYDSDDGKPDYTNGF